MYHDPPLNVENYKYDDFGTSTTLRNNVFRVTTLFSRSKFILIYYFTFGSIISGIYKRYENFFTRTIFYTFACGLVPIIIYYLLYRRSIIIDFNDRTFTLKTGMIGFSTIESRSFEQLDSVRVGYRRLLKKKNKRPEDQYEWIIWISGEDNFFLKLWTGRNQDLTSRNAYELAAALDVDLYTGNYCLEPDFFYRDEPDQG